MKIILMILFLLSTINIAFSSSFIELYNMDRTLLNINRINEISNQCGGGANNNQIHYMYGTKHYWLRYRDYKTCVYDYNKLRKELLNIDYNRCIEYGGGKNCDKYSGRQMERNAHNRCRRNVLQGE